MTSRYLEECLARGKLSVNICEGAEGAKGRQETAGESPTLKGRQTGLDCLGKTQPAVQCGHILRILTSGLAHALKQPWCFSGSKQSWAETSEYTHFTGCRH